MSRKKLNKCQKLGNEIRRNINKNKYNKKQNQNSNKCNVNDMMKMD